MRQLSRSPRRHRRARLTAALGLCASVMLIIGGCSSDDDSSGSSNATTAPTGDATDNGSGDSGASGESVDPCSLLTVEDLQVATGVDFGEGAVNDAMTNDTNAVCDWASSGDEFATAQVIIVRGGAENLDSQKEGADEVSPTSEVEVQGADQAYRTEEGSIVGMAIGDDFVQVSYIPSGPGDVGDATLQLAETAAANFGASGAD